MVLPVGETAQLALVSTDVNHSFWVPDFLSKRDLIPGVDNEIDVTPTEEGSYIGRCAEFCGLDHWRMYFYVRVVSRRRVPGLAGRAAGQGEEGGDDTVQAIEPNEVVDAEAREGDTIEEAP